ncbi:TPA: hypothetical protein JC757_002983 [Salmonella enterica subsp. diarizonae]|nr:hypothetical protein [Salmonella enterica subsp. diarizonae]
MTIKTDKNFSDDSELSSTEFALDEYLKSRKIRRKGTSGSFKLKGLRKPKEQE